MVAICMSLANLSLTGHCVWEEKYPTSSLRSLSSCTPPSWREGGREGRKRKRRKRKKKREGGKRKKKRKGGRLKESVIPGMRGCHAKRKDVCYHTLVWSACSQSDTRDSECGLLSACKHRGL